MAAQVAVALDNALHYDEAFAPQKELARESDRLQLVLDVNNSMVSNLDLRDLFHAISASLRRVIRHDSAALMLPDPRTPDKLRVLCAGFPDGRGFVQVGTMFRANTARNPGKAFRTGEAAAGREMVPTTCRSV